MASQFMTRLGGEIYFGNDGLEHASMTTYVEYVNLTVAWADDQNLGVYKHTKF